MFILKYTFKYSNTLQDNIVTHFVTGNLDSLMFTFFTFFFNCKIHIMIIVIITWLLSNISAHMTT